MQTRNNRGSAKADSQQGSSAVVPDNQTQSETLQVPDSQFETEAMQQLPDGQGGTEVLQTPPGLSTQMEEAVRLSAECLVQARLAQQPQAQHTP